MSDLLEAAIAVLEYVNIEILVHKRTKKAFLHVELRHSGHTFSRDIPEGDDVKPSFLVALADLSAAVDAQIEADTARDMEAMDSDNPVVSEPRPLKVDQRFGTFGG